MIKLLEKILYHQPYFPARGNAFILLSAIDNFNHKIIINIMNKFFDENIVKEYSVIGINLIHLSPNEFIDDLMKYLKNTHSKSKFMIYLSNEIGQFKSKKPVNYYYTDIKIPFTTTLENELYKAWIKIQGLWKNTIFN
ncbi:unnamed protein product [Rotaria sp. Silwood1]|nr:unnamed protein product [Rotaria sp. Silwood1]CAF1641075.1 unnamed protein product [Rotaria sp. Silwood1]CAF3853803.1 unnamed protein product [Rotaria sp. Silwood1]CAF5143154.1 unnamed protein product [Rotaria sp. Silwood1]